MANVCPGIVDQYVDFPESFHHLLNSRVYGTLIGNIASDAERTPSGSNANFMSRCKYLGLGPGSQRDIRSRLSKPLSNRFSDPAAGTGNDSHLSV